MIINNYNIEQGADLYEADLHGADLHGADLCGADLRRADLYKANLYEADLHGANLYKADLHGANLCGANLYEADLHGADLCEADLCGADLCGANLCEADLENTKLPAFQICPEEGSFIAWKKVDTGIIKLLIPVEAKRTSTLVGRKCRAEWVVVLEGSGKSSQGGIYEEGKEYRPDSYNPDIRIECSNGVHFFITRKEAEEY